MPGWVALAVARAVVYFLPGTAADAAAPATAGRLDGLLAQIERESGLAPSGRLIYPLYPSAERFQRDWWRFALLRDGTVHGWGTIAEGGAVEVSPYQVARTVVRQVTDRSVPLLSWGLGDLIADRLVGADSHAHARLFLDRGGLPPILEIVHQLDFSRSLPGAYAQSVSFLAHLAEENGLPAVVAFARAAGGRWYEFDTLFQRQFGIPVAEADRRWRERLLRVVPPSMTEAEFQEYRRGVEFVYAYTLARTTGGLVSRSGGARAYVEATRAITALRRFDLAAAARAVETGRAAGEQVRRRAAWTRLALQGAFWALGLGPIVLAVLLLAGPAIRGAWRDRRRRRTRRR